MNFKRVNSINEVFGKTNSIGLANKTAKSGYHSTVTQIVKFFLSTLSTVILARLLTPDDFGLIAMVAVFINLASMFKDAGLSMATVQKKAITQEEISALFWINVIISFSLALVMAAVSPLVISFYGRSEVGIIIIIMAISFFISGISIQHNALLQRLLRFDLIGIIQVVSQSAGLIAAVIFAVLGFDYMALVLNTLFVSTIMTLLTLFFIQWMPSMSLKFSKIKDMLIFGGDITAFNVINYFSRNADNILIGKFLGSGELGVYSKAYQIFMMPVKQVRIPINSVTIPVLSRLQDEPKRFRKYCSLIVELLAIISLPLTLVCFLEAEFIINLMLGDGWEKAIPVFKILALYGSLQVVLGIRGSVMVSMGLTRRYFWMGVIYAFANVISFIIGIQYGIIGVAAAYVAVQYILFVPSLFYSFYKTSFNVTAFFKSILPQLAITGVIVLLHEISRHYYEWNIFLSIFSILCIGLIFIIINYLRVDFRNQVFSIIKQVRS
ncbi:MAG: lipopolysaccharide biosynthesis protein [Balneolales bacterium]